MFLKNLSENRSISLKKQNDQHDSACTIGKNYSLLSHAMTLFLSTGESNNSPATRKPTLNHSQRIIAPVLSRKRYRPKTKRDDQNIDSHQILSKANVNSLENISSTPVACLVGKNDISKHTDTPLACPVSTNDVTDNSTLESSVSKNDAANSTNIIDTEQGNSNIQERTTQPEGVETESKEATTFVIAENSEKVQDDQVSDFIDTPFTFQ